MIIYILLLMLDILAVFDFRSLLFDFLIGAKNRKSAKRIHSEQDIVEKVTLKYIEPLLKKYKRQFVFFHRLYIFHIIALLLQNLILLVCVLMYLENIVYNLLNVLCLIKIALNLFLRLQVDSSRHSKYSKK